MTSTLRARFDGKVLIPEQQVDLPIDRVLELRVENGPQAGAQPTRGELTDLADWLGQQPLPEGWRSPHDGSIEHDHYLYGTPKREHP